jgi:hypothetical protein
MGSSTSTSSSSSRKPRRQTYDQFKTPESSQAAINRQKAILASTKTKTGAFANQEADLKKAGYTLSADKSSILKDGRTVAGVTGSGQLFSGSKQVSDIIKKSQPTKIDQTRSMSAGSRAGMRAATSIETMQRLEQLDEPSKARESNIQAALNYGRGVQPSPTVLDPTRIVASTPTMKELGGDIARGIMGGTAPSVSYLKKGYQAEPIKGLIPTITDAAMTGALSPTYQLLKSGVGFFQNDTPETPTGIVRPTESQEFADSQAEEKRKKKLAGSLDSSIAKGRSLFGTQARTITGGMA